MLKRLAISTALMLCLPGIAQAQITTRLLEATQAAQPAPGSDAPIKVGGFLGAQMDTSDDWFLLGGEVRLRIQNQPFEINPRLSFQPFEGGHTVQIDINVTRELELANQGRFRPVVGLGGAIVHSSFGDDSDNSLGLNLIGGVRMSLDANPRFEPYVQLQYTFLHDQRDRFTLSGGVTFALR
jgi:hypothetical protein